MNIPRWLHRPPQEQRREDHRADSLRGAKERDKHRTFLLERPCLEHDAHRAHQSALFMYLNLSSRSFQAT